MDLDAIRRVERIYRNRIRSQPCDTLARVRLAWCLFAQALHEAGRESAYATLRSGNVPPSEDLDEKALPGSERGATSLLDDCLRQTYAALHLGIAGRDQQDASELQALARLVSGEDPLTRAESWASEILAAIVADVMSNETEMLEELRLDDSEVSPGETTTELSE